MLKTAIQKLMCRKDLTITEMESAISEMMTLESEAQIAAFMVLLRAKGETTDEVYALVKAMRASMISVNMKTPVLDIVGTGGDGFNTINISTGSAILSASCGVKIAKHGNRSVSSLSGSADTLEKLGINLDQDKDKLAEKVDQFNFGFFYAPNFHPALSRLKQIRCSLAVPTTFNILGPLLNPANADYLMIGVLSQKLLELVSDVLLKLNITRGLVFHCAGVDEICCAGITDVIEIKDKTKRAFTLNPETYGFSRCAIEDLQGGSAEVNAALLEEIFKGKTGPIADTLILNAGLACYLYGVCNTIEAGIALATAKHQAGSAYRVLDNLRQCNKGGG